MISPLALWWRAIHKAEPGIGYDTFVGLSIAPADLAVCAPGCDCRLRHVLDRAAMAGVEACGFRVVSLIAAGEPVNRAMVRLESAARRGAPVVWRRGNDSGLVLGTLPDGPGIRVIRCGDGANLVCEELGGDACDVDLALGDSLFALRRSAQPRGLRTQRTLRALLEWLAASFRPPARGGCVSGVLAYHAEGLAAYDLWAGFAGREADPNHGSRVTLWRDARRSGAAYLQGLAGTRGTRYANRLRRAAELYEEECELCWNRPGSPTDAAIVEDASEMAHEAAILIGEAVLPALGLPVEAARALLEPPAERLLGVALNELLYLARAGTRPLRELAASRLAGSGGAAATSALIELLYDDDGRVASTALWSLLKHPTSRLASVLLGAARNGQRLRTDLDYSVSKRLVVEAALLDENAAERAADLREQLAAEDPESLLAGDFDAALSATRPGNP